VQNEHEFGKDAFHGNFADERGVELCAELRLAALLHDVGKPYCYANFGNYHRHEIEGARIAEEILTRLKAPNKVTTRSLPQIFSSFSVNGARAAFILS